MFTALWVLTLIWAIVATIMIIRNPLPFPDRGHRCFGVNSEFARKTVIQILEITGNLKERFTFDAGPTHQTLLWDGHTVINHLDAEASFDGRSGTAISLAVIDPRAAANRAAEILTDAGFTASIDESVMQELPPNHLILLQSNAFNGWVMIFRRSILRMPKPQTRKK